MLCVQVSSGIMGLGARKERLWPQELLPVARGLYHLQRSRILSSLGGPSHPHPDERELLVFTLLEGGKAACLPQVRGFT
jgi:hypothetical protein